MYLIQKSYIMESAVEYKDNGVVLGALSSLAHILLTEIEMVALL